MPVSYEQLNTQERQVRAVLAEALRTMEENLTQLLGQKCKCEVRLVDEEHKRVWQLKNYE
jgi:hypothetical protein